MKVEPNDLTPEVLITLLKDTAPVRIESCKFKKPDDPKGESCRIRRSYMCCGLTYNGYCGWGISLPAKTWSAIINEVFDIRS